MRLNKFLAERLGISRREADNLIAAGKVLLNGKSAILGARFEPEERPEIKLLPEGRILPLEVSYLYLAMNKPAGYVCSRRQQDDTPTLYELLPEKYRKLKTVGRLDKDSSGLLLLTNDGDFAYQMTHPKFAKSKTYEVTLERPLEPLHQQMIGDFGVELSDGRSQLGLERLDASRKNWRVIMGEGRNRQIRRTFGALGYTVVRLHRVGFGKYELSGLAEGEFVEIKPIA